MKILDLHADIGYDIALKRSNQESDVFMRHHYSKLQTGEITTTAVACYFEGQESWETMQDAVLECNEDIKNTDINIILNKNDFDTSAQQSVILTIEGMCGIDQDVEDRIQWLYDHGVRIGSLCWNEQNALATGKNGDVTRGLTDLGKRVIKKMNELKMIIDVSHANEKTFWDIIECSERPIIATHSNYRDLCNVERNLTFQQLKAIAQKGGLVGLNAAKNFVDPNPELQDVAHLAKHGIEMTKVVGIDHIAIGFDFMDFFESDRSFMAKGLESADVAQNLLIELQNELSIEDVSKIASENAIRFLKKEL